MVIVDTSAWIDFLKQPDSETGREVARLLLANDVTLVGLVLAEVLQGLKGQDFAAVRERMAILPYLEADQSAWIKAAELAVELRIKGLKTPLSDLVVAAQALNADDAVFATDAHFSRIPNLKLHAIPR